LGVSMSYETVVHWGMGGTPPIEGNPFELARSSCLHAAEVARDVSIDEARLLDFAANLNADEVQSLANGHLGENLDTVSDQFEDARNAVNFAVLFSLLQFGHGFRRELHEFCGVGASKTITLGTRQMRATGDLCASRLSKVEAREIRRWFGLPVEPALEELTMQLLTVLRQTGRLLERQGLEDFESLCRQVLTTREATQFPAATLVRELANRFPAFNDQAILADGSHIVLVKKATLATGEIRRLAAPHDPFYSMSEDLHRAVAPVDNVIPAMLVYEGVLRLSPALQNRIHHERVPLPRGVQEAELRAVALAACERVVAATGDAFSALDLGYYLWRSGKAPGKREFARHHTKDTIFY
jgi:hypothetical protein